MELTRKNDSALAGATKADRDSSGDHSDVSKDLRYRYADNGVLPADTGMVAFAIRDAWAANVLEDHDRSAALT
jgi:hypothetical protein